MGRVRIAMRYNASLQGMATLSLSHYDTNPTSRKLNQDKDVIAQSEPLDLRPSDRSRETCITHDHGGEVCRWKNKKRIAPSLQWENDDIFLRSFTLVLRCWSPYVSRVQSVI
jgi:hypothetical protein